MKTWRLYIILAEKYHLQQLKLQMKVELTRKEWNRQKDQLL